MPSQATMPWADLRFAEAAISPLREMGAYEALWLQPRVGFASLAKRFRAGDGALPSALVDPEEADRCGARVRAQLAERGVTRFGVRIFGERDYPPRLRDAKHPVEVLYYQGWWDLVSTRSLSVVGTREPSAEGLKRTRKLTELLVGHGFTIVSGLAAGVDTMAHSTCLDVGGWTIAVIGTPLGWSYPRENARLQARIAESNLLISPVPVSRYEAKNDWRANRFFFPERNKLMAALSEATIIVEASDTSGTLTQARACLEQGRKLFILDSCFRQPGLQWPHRFAGQGAIRVRDPSDILEALSLEP